jgi:PAS domain S-box-containing protein
MSLLLPQSSESAEQQEILDALPVLVFLERAGKVVFANAEARQLIGVDEPEWTPRPVDDIFWGLSSGTAEPRTVLTGTRRGSPFHATLTASDGRLLPIEGSYSLLNGQLCDAIIVAHPGGPRPAPRPRLMEDVLSSIPEAVVIVHGDRVLYTNPAFTHMFGYSADEAEGAELRELIVPESRAHEHAMLEMALELDAHRATPTVRMNKDGEPVEVSILSSALQVDGARVGCILSFRALSLGNQPDADRNDALHDPLTGLPNCALFRDRLSLALTRRSRRREQTCGVLLLALEPLGDGGDPQVRAAGDALLVAVAERLRAGLRLQDSAARLENGEIPGAWIRWPAACCARWRNRLKFLAPLFSQSSALARRWLRPPTLCPNCFCATPATRYTQRVRRGAAATKFSTGMWTCASRRSRSGSGSCAACSTNTSLNSGISPFSGCKMAGWRASSLFCAAATPMAPWTASAIC